MRHIPSFLLFILVISLSCIAWAGSCERCYVKVDEGKRFCEDCSLNASKDLTEMKAREEQIADAVVTSRGKYRSALLELVQFYMDIGYQLRLEKARNELKALDKIPQLKYLSARENVADISPSSNIDEANMLFQDGMNYKSILNLTKRKSKLSYAVARFKKILDDYPDSDKADDAAYELADIYEGYSFKDYEGSAFYYAKCYELNPNTDRPAHFKAARVYDKYLMNYPEAVRNYEIALEKPMDTEYRDIAKTRLGELRKQGY